MLNRMLLLGGGVLLACGTAMPATAATAIGTTNTFRFTGACSDCYGGRGNGTGTLVLTPDYQLGQDITPGNFVSFTYDGTDLLAAFTVTGASNLTLSGAMTGPLPDTENFSLFGPNELAFQSTKIGDWCVGYACTDDYGSRHLWSQVAAQSGVPEPASWAMLMLGFGMAGTALRRTRATARVTFSA